MRASPPDMLIISGLSGSGKSVALQSLEDIGYYCIDNLPAVLLPEFGRHLSAGGDEKKPPAGDAESYQSASDLSGGAAVSIDSRNAHFLLLLDENLRELERAGTFFRLLFLQADEQILIRRFSETRRKHPLTDHRTPLVDGIRQERLLLQSLHDRADKIIDTSATTPHELRGVIRDFAVGAAVKGPLFLLESFGFKFGSPREADFVFDVRCLPNPHWEENLRAQTGRDSDVQKYLGEHDSVRQMVEQIHRFLQNWLPGFKAENRSYFTVAIGCTGGRHRSVYIAEALCEKFAGDDIRVQVRHRELEK